MPADEPMVLSVPAGGRDHGTPQYGTLFPQYLCRPSLHLFHKLISIFCPQVAKLEGVIQGVRAEMIQAQEASNLVSD